MYRNLIEMSCMANNDMFVIYTNTEDHLKNERNLQKLARNKFEEPHLVLVRPVYPMEKVDFTFRKHIWDEKVDEVTPLLDALYKIRNTLRRMTKIREKHQIENNNFQSHCIAHYIATYFYDCMSGGMPLYEVIIMRYLVKQPSINLNEKVYPNSIGENNKWITLADWMYETRTAPNFEDILAKYNMNKNVLLIE